MNSRSRAPAAPPNGWTGAALVSLAASAENAKPEGKADQPKMERPHCRKPFSLGPNKLVLDDQYLCIDDGQLREILRAEKQNDHDQIRALLDEGCETLAVPMKASALDAEGEIVRVRLYNKRPESMVAYTTKAAIIDAADADVDAEIYQPWYAKDIRADEARAVRSICTRRWPDAPTRECCVLHETKAAVWLHGVMESPLGKNEQENARSTEVVKACWKKWSETIFRTLDSRKRRPATSVTTSRGNR